jgi:hypothetical protein
MIDFWEVFGRLMTHSNFRHRLYKDIRAGYYGTDATKQRIKIPKKRYDQARKHLYRIMPHRPISLMVAGELLMCISSDKFRIGGEKLAIEIGKTGVSTIGRRPLFYAALGLMLLDDNVRAAFKSSDFDTTNFGLLDSQDQEDLQMLAACSPLQIKANSLCNIFWGPACFDKFVFYDVTRGPSKIQHMHPSANDYPPY